MAAPHVPAGWYVSIILSVVSLLPSYGAYLSYMARPASWRNAMSNFKVWSAPSPAWDCVPPVSHVVFTLSLDGKQRASSLMSCFLFQAEGHAKRWSRAFWRRRNNEFKTTSVVPFGDEEMGKIPSQLYMTGGGGVNLLAAHRDLFVKQTRRGCMQVRLTNNTPHLPLENAFGALARPRPGPILERKTQHQSSVQNDAKSKFISLHGKPTSRFATL